MKGLSMVVRRDGIKRGSRRAGLLAWLAAALSVVGCASLAGTEGQPASSGTRATPGDLVVWSWRAQTAARIPGVTPMVWVDFNYGHKPKRTGTNYHTARPDHEIARDVLRKIDELRDAGRLHEGQLALFFWYVGGTADPMRPGAPRGLFPEGHAGEALRRGGFVEHTEQLVRRVMQRLNVEGVEPDFVVLDYEGGADRWRLGRREGQGNPAAYRQDVEQVFAQAGDAMPPALRSLGAAALHPGHAQYREAVHAFNVWAGERRSQALRRSVFEPTEQAFGRALPSSNYGESLRAWPTFDLNGWPAGPTERVAGRWSSPVTYLKDVKGNRYRGLSAEAALAQTWADQRNKVRSALAWSADVAPWYNNPDDGRPEGVDVASWRWAWAAGLMHDRAHGVRRMLLWSGHAGWSDEEVAFARPVFAALHALAADYRPNLEPVPLDQADAWLAGWVQRARDAMHPAGEAARDADEEAANPLR